MFNIAIIVIGVLIVLYLGLAATHIVFNYFDKWKVCEKINTIKVFVVAIGVFDLGVLALSFILEIGGIC